MGKCINHPDRETNYLCMKHNVYLCDECLTCQDPELYCKFRSSCPIWFIYKERKKREREQEEQEKAEKVKVVFLPDKKEVLVEAKTNLLDAAREAGIKLNASCNGAGACGKCKLIVKKGNIETNPTVLLSEKEKQMGYVLACQTKVLEDVEVEIPPETIERQMVCAGQGKEATEKLKGLVETIEPVHHEVELHLDPPTLEDSVSDLDRLFRGLKKLGYDTTRMTESLKVIQDLANVMRAQNWHITTSIITRDCSNEIVAVRPGQNKERNLGIAVDLGTTTIVVYLVDMSTGEILGALGDHNKQAACGDDVINRIVCAEKDGVKKLSKMAKSTINGLINEILNTVGADHREIKNVVVSGNTTMTHLFLGIEPRYIRRKPYIPTASQYPIFKAMELGLRTNPMAAVYVMPGPASYVGGDIVSGVLYCNIHKDDKLTLFVDVGTNGEIVLGNKEWLLTASCSAGPAFEGGGIRFGMRAEIGAIEKVKIDPQSLEPEIKVVGDVKPRGICGSGMIDLMAEMLKNKIIQPNGKFNLDTTHPRIKEENGEKQYILAIANKETELEQDIVFTESDISNLIRSKGAIYAGFRVLLKQAGLSFNDLDQMLIAGGFGEHLDVERAITIGLLPDIDRSKFKYVGNSSIAGAYMCLLSKEARKQAREICNSMTYIDFSDNTEFMEEFTSALFLPHTELKDFPSVKL